MQQSQLQNDHPHSSAADRLRTVSRWVFFGFVAIAAFFLITEHRAHLYGWLPFLLLAACPLLHFFHHGGHGRGADKESGSKGSSGTSGHSH